MFTATLGGVGGTSAILPITLIFWDFSVHRAVSHTALFAFVSTSGRVVYEIVSTYAKPKEKKINFHLVILSAPVMFFGSFIGVNLNKMSPAIFILVGMTVVLGIGVYKSIGKCMKKRKEELERMKKEKQVLDSYKSMGLTEDLLGLKEDNEAEDDGDLRGHLQQQTDTVDIVMLGLICTLNPLLSLFRGSASVKSIIGSKHCSFSDSLIITVYLVIVLALTYINAQRMLEKNKEVVTNHKQIKLTRSNIVKLLATLFLVGAIGSFLSAGMVVLFTLALIFSGLSPFVASPTALILTCMTSASNSILFALNKKISPKAALLGSVVIMTFSMGTRLTVYKTLMKNGRESVILSFIILLVVVAIPANLIKTIPEIIERRKDGQNVFAFNSICNQ